MPESSMAEELEWFRAGIRSFGDRVAQVGPDQWSAPTPDEGWDVRALVNHVAGECAWVPPLLAGSTIGEVGDSLDGDLLGDDPQRAWRELADASVEAMAADGALSRTVHLSYGEESAAEYCRQVAFDALVHAWDLARAIGADETLDPQAVAWAQAWMTPEKRSGYGGAFAAEVAVPDDASPQDRLIAMTGRQP